MWFGDLSNTGAADLAQEAIRSTNNFNWTFIAIFAFVVYVYATELHKKIIDS